MSLGVRSVNIFATQTIPIVFTTGTPRLLDLGTRIPARDVTVRWSEPDSNRLSP